MTDKRSNLITYDQILELRVGGLYFETLPKKVILVSLPNPWWMVKYRIWGDLGKMYTMLTYLYV